MASVVDPVLRWAEKAPDGIAIRAETRTWTYSELRQACLEVAETFTDAGARTGGRVVLIAPSVPEFVIAYLAVQALGGVVISMNTMSTRDEIRYVLRDSDADLVVAWHDLGPAATDAAVACDVPLCSLVPYSASSRTSAPSVVDRELDDTAAILYTSGTTGRPKGAELTVGNVLEAGEISVLCSGGSDRDRIGTGLPLFHIFGQISVMMAGLTTGASLTLISPFTPSAMVKAIERDELTVIAGVPTMWNAMLHDPFDNRSPDFTHLRLAVSGGAALPGYIADEFERRFGCRLLEGYGMTETASLGTFHDVDSPHAEQSDSVGTPVPRTRVEVRDSADRQVSPGTVGEVFISGPSVMKGYWNRPADTAAALSDGWLRTGDLGMFDANNRLHIVDRLKDLIIRGGYNVYPSEVEEVLHAHPDIVEVAVVGVADQHYGEEVAAVIVLRPEAAVPGEAITAWSRERLSAYKIPRIVKFVNALPKGPSGKILKRALDVAGLPD